MKKTIRELKGSVKNASVHSVEVSETEANRIVNSGSGVLVLSTGYHQYQKGDIIKFDAMEDDCPSLRDTFNPINDQLYIVTYVYSGRGVEHGYVVVAVEYYKSTDENG